MSGELNIRRVHPDERDRVRKLNRAAMAETPEWIADYPDEDLQNIESTYFSDGNEFLVGLFDGEIVATAAYMSPDAWKTEFVENVERTAELTRMRVDPAWQGRGFGRKIYQELECRACNDGYRQFVLDTGVENTQARGFYEDLGFVCLREVALDYQGLTVELAVYKKRIND